MTTDLKLEAQVIVQGLMIEAMAWMPARPNDTLHLIFEEKVNERVSALSSSEFLRPLAEAVLNASMEMRRRTPAK